MADNETVGEITHGKAEEVTADSLDDVLHEFGAVGFDAFPFLCGTHAFIGDGLPAEPVFPDLRLYVRKVPARGESDEEHAAFALKTDAVHACPHALSDGGFHCGVNIPPEPYDVWVGCAPCIHKGAEFVFGKSHLKSTH